MSRREFSEARSEGVQQEQAETQGKARDRLGEFIERIYTHPSVDLAAELELERYHFLAPLEEAGILPRIDDPNPHDPDRFPDEYEQWWQDHPGDLQAFEAAFIRREQALRDLWLGVVLYRMTGGKLFEGLVESRQIANRLSDVI